MAEPLEPGELVAGVNLVALAEAPNSGQRGEVLALGIAAAVWPSVGPERQLIRDAAAGRCRTGMFMVGESDQITAVYKRQLT